VDTVCFSWPPGPRKGSRPESWPRKKCLFCCKESAHATHGCWRFHSVRFITPLGWGPDLARSICAAVGRVGATCMYTRITRSWWHVTFIYRFTLARQQRKRPLIWIAISLSASSLSTHATLAIAATRTRPLRIIYSYFWIIYSIWRARLLFFLKDPVNRHIINKRREANNTFTCASGATPRQPRLQGGLENGKSYYTLGFLATVSGLRHFPPALDHIKQVSLMSSNSSGAVFLASLNTVSFRCFQILQAVKIASVWAILLFLCNR